MNILMTNIDLMEIGGTQTWTKTVAEALKDMGHTITFMSGRIGKYYNRELAHIGPAIKGALDVHSFDFAIVNHPIAFGHLFQTDLFCMSVTHGPSHRLETPAGGADKYFCVSEEIKDTYRELFDMEVLRQPVDMNRFQPKWAEWSTLIPETIKTDYERPRVFINCKNKMAMEMAMQACAVLGFQYDAMHYKESPIFDPVEKMQRCNIAITSGRGAVEAMAMGMGVIIFDVRKDRRGYIMGVNADGWVTPDNVEDIASVNYSGRFTGRDWTVGDLQDALKNWQHIGMMLRWVKDNHNAHDIADRFASEVEYANIAS
jgi:hypothetical protein